MAEEPKKTLNETVRVIATDEINKIPYPTTATITKVYDDGHADCKTKMYGDLIYVKTIAPCNTGAEAILIFLNNGYDDKVLIPNIHDIINTINNRLDTIEETIEENEETQQEEE